MLSWILDAVESQSVWGTGSWNYNSSFKFLKYFTIQIPINTILMKKKTVQEMHAIDDRTQAAKSKMLSSNFVIHHRKYK